MIDQIFSWGTLLSLIGVIGFHFAGEQKWWAWYINIANQILWFTYAIATEQYGFFIGAIFFSVVFVRNAIKWTKKHFRKVPSDLFVNIKFDNTHFDREIERSKAAIDALSSEMSASEVYRHTKDIMDTHKLRRTENDLKGLTADYISQHESGFKVGDLVVRKKGSYKFASHVRVIFRNGAGTWNLVCENVYDKGLLHIFAAHTMEKVPE